MARLMSQVKGGYYAAAPEAVAAVLERLRPPDTGECLISTRAAGEGRALLQLAARAPCGSLRHRTVGGSCGRGAGVAARRPGAGPGRLPPLCDQLPLVLLRVGNPPYDYATGDEGRVESQFIERAAHLLADNGVLALVCPEDVADSYQTAEFFEEHFYQVSAMPFPEEVRKYNETVILGCKRKQPRASRLRQARLGLAGEADGGPHRLHAAAGQRPRQFRKTEPTDTELARLVAQSPLAVPHPAAGGQGRTIGPGRR